MSGAEALGRGGGEAAWSPPDVMLNGAPEVP